MKNLKKIITSPITTLVLFAAAAGLLLFSTIGGVRAAFIAYSETYAGQVRMYDIGVSLLEKSAHDEKAREVGYRNYIQDSKDEWDEYSGTLLENLLDTDGGEEFVPGKTYTEEISVANTGTINEYVRVTIYKYWTDSDGNKVFTDTNAKGSSTPGLAPSLIHLEYANQDNGSGNGDWILDTENSAETEERTVFYYNKLLKSGEDTADTPLTSTLTVDPAVAAKVTQSVKTSDDGKHKVITTHYDYDGWQFCIDAHVDAVQEHNAVDAIKSAWGRDVTIRDNGTLRLD